MATYTAITIIYNPKSTGDSKPLALDLEKQIKTVLPHQAVTTVPTEYVGHAESLAYELSTATERPLIISSSGDGGYHEVVNGVMRAQSQGSKVTSGLLPAGNANDHFHNLHTGELPELIKKGKSQTIDLLKLRFTSEGQSRERYAHSYIGIGLTPQAGTELNKHTLNFWKEIWIIAKVLFMLRPVRLRVGTHIKTYDSLIFSNVPRMSKILSLSDIADARDGKFEITAFRRHGKLRLIGQLFAATTQGLHGTKQATDFRFTTLHATEVQLDGEIVMIDPKCNVTVSIEPRVLKCVI